MRDAVFGIVALFAAAAFVRQPLPPNDKQQLPPPRIKVRVGDAEFEVTTRANAEQLSRVQKRAMRVVRSIGERLRTNPDSIRPQTLIRGITHLVDRHEKSINVHEIDTSKSDSLAYNENKGDAIYVCLNPEDDDATLFILLHELAHTASPDFDPSNEDGSTAHTKQFGEYEHFIYGAAASLGELNPLAQPGKLHCGKRIRHPTASSLPRRVS